MNWRDHLPIHPAAELFPLMSEAELKELADDIKKNGLKEPVALHLDQKTKEERWRNSLANLAGDVLARQPYWDKHFPEWQTFSVPSHIQKLVREAATEFASLAAQLTPTAPKISDDLSIPDFMRRGAP